LGKEDQEPPSVSDVNPKTRSLIQLPTSWSELPSSLIPTLDVPSSLSAWAVDGLALAAVIFRSARAQTKSLADHIVGAALLATFVPGVAASFAVFAVNVVIVASLASVGSGSDLLIVGSLWTSESNVVVGELPLIAVLRSLDAACGRVSIDRIGMKLSLS